MTTTTSGQFNLFSRCLALAIVVVDIAQIHYPFEIDSALLALIGLVGVLCLNHDAAPALGLQPVRNEGWHYWIQFGMLCGIAIGVTLAMFALIWHRAGWKIPLVRTEPNISSLMVMCVRAPIVEETIYRSLLLFAVSPTLGKTGAILCSGIVFAWGHVLAGVASPENQLAGFLLAWAFFRSGSILVPLALHSAGNFFALAAHWYWH